MTLYQNKLLFINDINRIIGCVHGSPLYYAQTTAICTKKPGNRGIYRAKNQPKGDIKKAGY